MTGLLATTFLAQRADWVEGAIILLIFALSAIGGAGKWIVQKMAERRERVARQREGMPIDPPRAPVRLPDERHPARREEADRAEIPPYAAPVPPSMERTRRTTMPSQPPVMERMLEVILEKAAGTKLERRIREAMPQQPTPPPPPSARTSDGRVRKSSAQRTARPQKATRPMTLAERESNRDRTRRTEVEQESRRRLQRDQQYADDTELRLGRVETHIHADEIRDSDSMDSYNLATGLEDPDALRRAIIYSEILGPPVASRLEN